MSLNLNNVQLAGNLTRDPEVKTLSGDKMVAQFGLAINHKYKTKDGEKKEDTTFVDVEAWGRTAELVGQYLTKGRPVYVEGRLRLDQWEDKDGAKRSKLKVVADNIQFLGERPQQDGAGEAKPQAAKVSGSGTVKAKTIAQQDEESVPF